MMKWITLLLLCVGVTSAFAQTPYHPSRAEELARYRSVLHLDSVARRLVFKTSVRAHWLPGGKGFWYVNFLADSTREYIYADVAQRKKQPAFDADKLASASASVLGHEPDPRKLRIEDLRYDKNGDILAELEGKWLRFKKGDYTCSKTDNPGKDTTHYPELTKAWSRWNGFSTDDLSPDKQWVAFIKDGNLFVKPKEGNAEPTRFTQDGTEENPYGSLAWSPDSKYLVGYHIHPVIDSPIYYILSSVPGTTRGQLHSQPYKQPGDPFTTFEMYVFTLSGKRVQKVNTPLVDFFDAPALHWRENDPRYFLYEKVDRGHQRFRIIEVDAASGDTRTILDEQAKTFIYESRIFTEYLEKTNEIIWTSEKDGWRHIYLVDGLDGHVKNQITRGNWVVRDIDSVDRIKREVWFTASGMNPGEDPYFVHYYRIGFDGKGLTSLTPETGNHSVAWSPDKRYFLDTWSQVNVPPVTVLRGTADGRKVMDVEQADVTAFTATGVPLPTVFTAKGRDGVTDIWGIMCLPTHMDTTQSYPVIENIYAGPQDAFVPKNFMPYGEMQSMAELGFIVVQMDGMGTANRSKAFHDVCWKNLADAGFPDRILWIKALGRKYHFVDTTRVGLYGTSAGGQNSTGGLLFHPEFYKAAVSACGCHDNRIDKQWWNEQWMGYPVGEEYAEQSNITNAGKLQGHLFLIVGENDHNVPPESTYRLCDALIKAGKTFDFLTVPGMDHSDGGPYGRAKKRDFFVRYLLGVEPPDRNAGELARE